MKSISLWISAFVIALSSSYAFACGGDNSGKHFGTVLKVNEGGKTITIRDVETSEAITFNASSDMLKVASSNKNVVIDYEENSDGGLKATMVSPAAF
ncbi:MAG: hypothetical protein OEZ47_06765 [Gammaproteobacteria bacterium]|nr:hypothetical protein [Gammaproteobacteria bacterium]